MADTTGWVEYINRARPSLDVLEKYGCTKGEALMVLELNAIQQVLGESRIATVEVSNKINCLVEALRKPDDGESWKDGG